jgi:TatD DNase family protein
MRYFDAHCHVQFPKYDEDRDAVLASMRENKVGGLVVGCDIGSSRSALALVEQEENLYAAVGLHPNHEEDEWYEASDYRALALHPKVRAIGECGLDYFRPETIDTELKRKQKNLFQDHIDLAIEVGKPLIIHARPTKGTVDAYEDALEMLERAKENSPSLTGDFHFFVGDAVTAARIVALGFTISYTAVLTFTSDYDEVVRSAPLSAILSETDSPYAAPAGKRGERNTPLATIDVVAAIARIRGEDEEVVREALLANSRRMFSI